MQRDIDLIRKTLFEVEKKDTPTGWIDIEVDGYSKEQIAYHVKLLAEAGYLEAKNLTNKDGFDWQPVSLTWQGHDFLDAARDNNIWNKAKKHLGNKLKSVSFEVLKCLLVSYGKQTLGL
jgi:hypothetical protein